MAGCLCVGCLCEVYVCACDRFIDAPLILSIGHMISVAVVTDDAHRPCTANTQFQHGGLTLGSWHMARYGRCILHDHESLTCASDPDTF